MWMGASFTHAVGENRLPKTASIYLSFFGKEVMSGYSMVMITTSSAIRDIPVSFLWMNIRLKRRIFVELVIAIGRGI